MQPFHICPMVGSRGFAVTSGLALSVQGMSLSTADMHHVSAGGEAAEASQDMGISWENGVEKRWENHWEICKNTMNHSQYVNLETLYNTINH